VRSRHFRFNTAASVSLVTALAFGSFRSLSISAESFLLARWWVAKHNREAAMSREITYYENPNHRRGKPTVHYVARIGGGHLFHSLPEGQQAALCGIVPGGGRKTRGKWMRFTRESQDRFGVTCKKCQAAEPTPAAESSLAAVLERCVDGVREVPDAQA